MPIPGALEDLLHIRSVSGDEKEITKYILNYVQERKIFWKVQPEIYYGEEFHDCLLLKFGNPRTAIFAHVDTIGFMSRYQNQLIPVGGPELDAAFTLEGEDDLGPIHCRLNVMEDELFHDFPRAVRPGTYFSFKQHIRSNETFIQAAYLDNRLGVYNALLQCEEVRDAWVVFSTYEEHGGGSMPFLLRFIMDTHPVKQALISDITWVTEGVRHGEGVAISLRDRYIPRRAFLEKIVSLAKQSGVSYQLEVEAHGGSDGREVQFSPYALDWCFIGAPEDHVHTPNEKVYWKDFYAMVDLYKYLLEKL